MVILWFKVSSINISKEKVINLNKYLSSQIYVTYTKVHPHVSFGKHLYGIQFEVYCIMQAPSVIWMYTEQKGEKNTSYDRY